MHIDNEFGGNRSCHGHDGISFGLMGCREDEDFKKSPWLLAVDFIEKQQSRLGTVDASIHRKVIEEDKFGKYLSVESVVILHQVAMFCSCRYLNITLNNMIEVISKECCSAREITSSARTCVPGNRETLAGVTEFQHARTMENARLNQVMGNRRIMVKQKLSILSGRIFLLERLKHNVNMPQCHSESHEIRTCMAAVAGNSGLHLNSSKLRTAGVKKLIGTSLKDWTDQQIDELFVDYQDIF